MRRLARRLPAERQRIALVTERCGIVRFICSRRIGGCIVDAFGWAVISQLHSEWKTSRWRVYKSLSKPHVMRRGIREMEARHSAKICVKQERTLQKRQRVEKPVITCEEVSEAHV